MTFLYHSVLDSPHYSRELAFDSAQNAVAMILGELWPAAARVSIPSAALAGVLMRVGITEAATRAALSRMSRKGTLETGKDGRQTYYRLSEEVAASIPRSGVLTMGFGAEDRPWSGEWTVVIFSIPESQRDKRQSLREWLRWLGFGPVRDGVWIAPHDRVGLASGALEEALPEDALVFRATHLAGNPRLEEVWPLADIAAGYQSFIDEYRPQLYELRSGRVGPADGLRLWLNILSKWRRFPTSDPDLPASALPEDWPLAEARRIFEAVHDASVLLAAACVKAGLEESAPAAAATIRGLSVQESYNEYRKISAGTPASSLYDLPRKLLPVAAQRSLSTGTRPHDTAV